METFLNTFLLAYSAFIPVLNPFGGAMFLLALTPGVDDSTRGAMVRRIVFYSSIILFASLFAGHLDPLLFRDFAGCAPDVRRDRAFLCRLDGSQCARGFG